MNRPSVLVLGGTGAMGGYLVPILSKDYNVYVTSRTSRDPRANVYYIQGNAHDIFFLENVLKERKYKAIIDFMNYSTNEYKSRYKLFLDSSDQLFFISSSRVYSNINGRIVESDKRLLDSSTDTIFLKSDDYALAKARQEDLLRASGKNNWTIIRPYMTYSPFRLDIGMYPKEMWLYRLLKGRTIVFPEDVANKYVTLTSGKDVAEGIAALVGNATVLGETFHITQSKAYTWKEIIETYLDELSLKGFCPKVIWVKKPMVDEGYIYHYDRLYDRVFDNSKINGFIDVSHFIDAKCGIRSCLSEFLLAPSFQHIDWKKQACWDRVTGECARKEEFDSLKNYLIYLTFRYILPYSKSQSLYRKIKQFVYGK